MDKVHYSSKKMDWVTPPEIFDPLHAEFHFGLDVCATMQNAQCDVYFSPAENGLEQDWAAHSMGYDCWMNPPYGRALKAWMQKAWKEKQRGVTTVCLVPARTDTQWWSIFWDHDHHGMRDHHDEVRFVKGRIKFMVMHKGEWQRLNPAPFPSAIVVLRGVV